MKRLLIAMAALCATLCVQALGKFGDWTCSVALCGGGAARPSEWFNPCSSLCVEGKRDLQTVFL
ncbi:MAG: hypothetical protein IJS97_05490 [Prevotella sp.]|nr:hypothetical protein [Prevotella sp.]